MPQRPGNKPLSWKAHDGLVLAADWNPANNLIASCGEDCKFRIWDAFGRQLFASSPYDYVMTSVAWSPSGELLAAGSFEMLRLCDKSGWTHSFVKPECGSVMAMNWSPDGTVLACGCGNGSVLFGHLVDRHLSWGNIEVNVEDEKVVSVTDVLHGVKEDPDFRDRVVNVSVGYGYLVVATT